MKTYRDGNGLGFFKFPPLSASNGTGRVIGFFLFWDKCYPSFCGAGQVLFRPAPPYPNYVKIKNDFKLIFILYFNTIVIIRIVLY